MRGIEHVQEGVVSSVRVPRLSCRIVVSWWLLQPWDSHGESQEPMHGVVHGVVPVASSWEMRQEGLEELRAITCRHIKMLLLATCTGFSVPSSILFSAAC